MRDGERFGFKVIAGGGLGHKPHEAIVVEAFIEEHELLIAMEAMVTLHNKYSDRTKRAKSRIKFLVERFGAEGFLEKYREEFARTQAGLPTGRIRPASGAPVRAAEARAGCAAPRVCAEAGGTRGGADRVADRAIFTPCSCAALPLCCEHCGLTEMRTTQDQNLMVLNVPEPRGRRGARRFARLGFVCRSAGDNVVACPGTSTCRLGITSTMLVAPKLGGGERRFAHSRFRLPQRLRPARDRRHRYLRRRQAPARQAGAALPDVLRRQRVGGRRLAIKGPSVPTQRVQAAIDRVQQAYSSEDGGEALLHLGARQGQQYFRDLLADLTQVEADEVHTVMRDHGDTADFRVLHLGGGECAGASQVMIGANFFEAAHEREYRDALLFQRKYAEAAKCTEAICAQRRPGARADRGRAQAG